MTDNLFTAFRRTFPEPSRIFLERPDGTTLSYGDLLDLSVAARNGSSRRCA